MLRKTLIIVCVLLITASASVFADSEYYQLDVAEDGVVVVTYPVESDVRYKAMLKKDGEKYYYDLTSDHVRLPLQMGEGTYEFAILKNVSGKSYSYVYETTFKVDQINNDNLFLNSTVNVDWAQSDLAIPALNGLVNSDMSDAEKLSAIHESLAETLSYDYEKFSKIQGAYLPNIDATFGSRTGICYDFSSLLAAMLRSEGIPTKLVMGYRADTSVYHAWNEVLIDGEWLIVDLTLDVEYFAKGWGYELTKDAFFYNVKAVY
jgi:transglutaminase-like putative cysteine protease